MLPITNIYKRLLVYTLISNRFPVQCSETIWYLIQLSELPIEIKYLEDGYVTCQLVSYHENGRRIKQLTPFKPRNTRENQIVETFLQMIYSNEFV